MKFCGCKLRYIWRTCTNWYMYYQLTGRSLASAASNTALLVPLKYCKNKRENIKQTTLFGSIDSIIEVMENEEMTVRK